MRTTRSRVRRAAGARSLQARLTAILEQIRCHASGPPPAAFALGLRR